MNKRFCITWREIVKFDSSIWIEAESEEEALQKWRNGEYEGDYEREEVSNSFERNSEAVVDVEKK
jgi:hypothetical protein